MISLHKDRRIVPRWRRVKSRDSLVEERPLGTGGLTPLNRLSQIELDETIERWKHDKSVGVALEILNSPADLADSPVLAEAAHIVLAHKDAGTLARVIAGANAEPNGNSAFAALSPRTNVPLALARAALRRDPYNAIAALNLAHAYCGIGRVDKAHRLVLQALAVAGTNRTILRGAARFYLHVKDFGHAHSLLARAPGLLHDPWLLAGELALSEVIGKTSQHMKRAKLMAQSDSLEAINRSELNAAIGDVQRHRGDHRHARKSYVAALVRPTENVIAQAHFLSTRGDVTNLPWGDAMKHVTAAPEASGMDALLRGDWKVAKEQARIWLDLEPFSNRPVNLGFTASELGDNDMESALFFAERGQRSNPGQPMQHNNYAFALAKLGRIAEAEEAFAVCRSLLAKEEGDPGERHVYKATAALIAWRAGDVEGGRRGYREAAEYFEKSGQRPRLAVALWRWAEEEVRAGNIAEAGKLLERAKGTLKPKERTLHHVAVDKFEEMLKGAVQSALPQTPATLVSASAPASFIGPPRDSNVKSEITARLNLPLLPPR